MRNPKIPRGARQLRTYPEFQSYLANFVAGLYAFLWIVGRPGLAKTQSIRVAIGNRPAYYRKGGQLTPAQFYRDLYYHRGQPVILDDAEHVLESKIGRSLVAALGDTTRAKELSYATTSRVLGDVPDRFSTTSPLAILANKVTAHEDIQSRAVVLSFEPTNLQIHQAVAAWYWDQEIHDWFGHHLHRLPPLDARWYVHAAQDKRAGRDWRRIQLTTHTPDRAICLIQDLEVDVSCPSREAKATRFVETMGAARGASRATYFRLRSRLEAEDRLIVSTVPPTPLRRTRPPATPSLLELDALAMTPQLEQPEDEPTVVDLPAREQFAQPVRGHNPIQAPVRPRLDDSLPWEASAVHTEDDEE